MIYLFTVATGFGAALIPLVNIEAFLLGLLAMHRVDLVAAAAAGALGQTAGKMVVFLSARQAVRWEGPRRWRERCLERLRWRRGRSGRSARGVTPKQRWASWYLRASRHRNGVLGVILLSSVAGLPPLLLTSVVAGGTPIRVPTFAVACLSGRFVRFAVLLAMPAVVLPLLR